MALRREATDIDPLAAFSGNASSPANDNATMPVTLATPTPLVPSVSGAVVAPPVPEPPNNLPQVSTQDKVKSSDASETAVSTVESIVEPVSAGAGAGGASLLGEPASGADASIGTVSPNALPAASTSPSAEAAKRFVATQQSQAPNSAPTPKVTNPWQEAPHPQSQPPPIDPKQQQTKKSVTPSPPVKATTAKGQTNPIKPVGSEETRMGLGVAFGFNDNTTENAADMWSSLEGAGGDASGDKGETEGLFKANTPAAAEAEDDFIASTTNNAGNSKLSNFASSILDEESRRKPSEAEGENADDVLLSMKASSKLVFGQQAGTDQTTVEDALFGGPPGGDNAPSSSKVVQQNGGRAQDAAAARAEVSSLLDDGGLLDDSGGALLSAFAADTNSFEAKSTTATTEKPTVGADEDDLFSALGNDVAAPEIDVASFDFGSYIASSTAQTGDSSGGGLFS